MDQGLSLSIKCNEVSFFKHKEINLTNLSLTTLVVEKYKMLALFMVTLFVALKMYNWTKNSMSSPLNGK